MKRRQFLVFGAVGSCFLASRKLAVAASRLSTPSTHQLTFFVAGARYYQVSRIPSTHEHVRLEPALFRGSLCYRVISQYGEQLGHVPKDLLPAFTKPQVREGCLTSVDRYAVPWKRYQVALRLGALGSN